MLSKRRKAYCCGSSAPTQRGKRGPRNSQSKHNRQPDEPIVTMMRATQPHLGKGLKHKWCFSINSRGAVGVDGVRFEDLNSIEIYGQLIKTLIVELVNGTYKPLPVKRVQIPKDNGRTRNLGIPSIRDRIV